MQRILEVLSPEKRRRAITLAQFHLFYFSGYSTSKMHFGSTVPGKIGRALHTHAGPILPFFIFPGTVLPFTAHFGSTVPGKIVSAYLILKLEIHYSFIHKTVYLFLFLFFRGHTFYFGSTEPGKTLIALVRAFFRG